MKLHRERFDITVILGERIHDEVQLQLSEELHCKIEYDLQIQIYSVVVNRVVEHIQADLYWETWET